MKKHYLKLIESETAERAAYIDEHGESEYTGYWARYIDYLHEKLLEAETQEENEEEDYPWL